MLRKLMACLLAVCILTGPAAHTAAEAGWKTKAALYLGVRAATGSFARKTVQGAARKQVIGLLTRGPGVTLRSGVTPMAAGAEAAASRVAQRLATGTPKKINPLKLVNPGGGTTNCVQCAIATDKTLSGMPSSAKLIGGKGQEVADLTRHYGQSFNPPMTLGRVERELKALPEGGRAIIFGARAGEPGHVFNALTKNGRVRFLDGQSGGYANLKDKTIQFYQYLRTNP